MSWQQTFAIISLLLGVAALMGWALYLSRQRERALQQSISERQRVQAALVAERDYSQLLLNTANVMIVGLDAQGQVTIFNKRAEQITGYSRAQLEGKNWFEALSPRERYPQVWKEFAQLTTAGVPDTFENPLLTADGQERIIAWRNNVLRQGDRTLGTISFGLDVTEQRQTQKALVASEQRYRTVVEKLGEGISVVDAQLRFVFANAAAEKAFGLSPLNGQDLGQFIPPDQRATLQEQTARRRQGETSTYELEIVRPDGARRRLLVTASPQGGADAQFAGTLAVFRDVTEMRQTELQLQRQAAQLEILSEVGSQIASTLELADVLERAAQLVHRHFGYHHVALFTLDQARSELLMRAKAGQMAHLYPPGHRLRLGKGMVGWVGQSGERLLANNVHAEPRYINLYPDLVPTQSELCVPLRAGTDTVGVLDVQSPQLDAFDQNDVRVLQTLADQIAIAIANARLYEAVQRELAERQVVEVELRSQKQLFENLVAVARATAERPTLESTLQNALDVAARLTGAEHGNLLLVDETGAVTYGIFLGGKTWSARREASVQAMDRGLAGWVARYRQAALVADTALDKRWVSLADTPQLVRSALSLPLLGGPVLLGVLTLTHPEVGHYSHEHLQLMQAAADQMALAVRNAQMFEAQRRTAERELTLNQVLGAVSGQLDPAAVSRAAVEAIDRFAGWPHAAIALPDKARQHWQVRAAGGIYAAITDREFSVNQGIVGRAIRTAQTQNISDVLTDPDYIQGENAIRSELAVPIRRGRRVLGILNIESDERDAFSRDDVLLAEALADAVALALENASLYAETRQRAADLSALYAISRATGQSLALDEVFAQTLSSAIALFGFEAGMICLVEDVRSADSPQPHLLRLAADRGLPPAHADRLRQGPDDHLSRHVYERRETIVIGDVTQEQPFAVRQIAAELAEMDWRACAAIPLVHEGERRALGTLTLFSRRPHLASPYDLALLTTVGSQVTTAVENARLFQSTLYERSRLQALIKASRDGVVLIGMDGRVLVVNAQAVEFMRLPGQPEDWLATSIMDVLRVLHIYAPSVVRAMLPEIRRIRKGDEPPSEGELQVLSRTLHWLSLPVLAMSTPLGRLLVLRDVTAERQVERLRDDMTHTMVHDLRNPLSSIYSALVYLEDDATQALDPDQRELLRIASDSSQRMLNLVNGILDVSRLESGRMPLNRTRVQVRELATNTLHIQAPLAAEKKLQLDNSVPNDLPPVWADPNLVGRVLQNLIGNAIKFTPVNGTVRVTARTGESGDKTQVYISVSDSGPGIPEQIRGRLFQRFVTGPQAEHGSGLGLAFCKVAVEAHGGQITIDSAPGLGATFTFGLPVNAHTGN